MRLGLVHLAVALGFFALTAIQVDPNRSYHSLLAPWPDAAEYVDFAVNWVERGERGIHLAGETHPSRYPPGYPALLAVANQLGVPFRWAPLVVNRIFAVFLLLAVFGILAARGQPGAGGLAALLLAVQPSFVVLSRAPLSEIASAACMLAAAWLLYTGSERADLRRLALGAFILGLAVNIRVSNALFGGLVLAALYAAPWANRLRPAAVAGTAFAVAVLPLALHNYVAFGAPWRNGYGYWLDSRGAVADAFDFINIVPQLYMFWAEITQAESLQSTAGLFGAGSYVAPAFLLLVLFALFARRPNPRLFAFLIAGLGGSAVLLFYYFADFRLHFAALVLAVPLVALHVSQRLQSGPAVVRLPLALLLVAAVLGWPGRRSALEAADMVRTPNLDIHCMECDSVDAFNRVVGDKPYLALVDMNPPYVHARTTGDRWIAPLDDVHDYRFHKGNFDYGREQRLRLVERARAEGREVYVVVWNHILDDMTEDVGPLEILWENERRVGVARLKLAQEGPP